MSRRKDTGVFELPDGRCGIDYYDAEGGRHRELIGRRKLAIEEFRRRKLEILEGKHRPPRRERKTFSEVMAEYLESKEGRVSYYTHKNNKLRARILEESLGHQLIDKIDHQLLTKTLTRIKNTRSISGPTTNRFRNLLVAVFNFAVRGKYIEANPIDAKSVEPYPEPKGRVRYATADEELAFRRIMQTQGHPTRELEFDLALFTGLRKTEQYTAKWSKVDLENRLMTVVGKSRGGIVERTIKLNAVAAETLQKLYLLSGGSSYVIPVRWGGNRPRKDREGKKDERRWFDEVVKEAGVENFRWHDLRHTFASRAVMNGVPLEVLMKLLGHTSLRMTMIYAHLSPEHFEDQLKKIKDTRNLGIGSGNDSLKTDVLQIDVAKAVSK